MQQNKSSPFKSPKKSISPRQSTPLKSSPSSQRVPKSAALPRHFSEPTSGQMISNREKLCEALDTYTLLIRSKNPIRCLQHNSNISIYCETEQKLLCANCIFGRIEHKFHRVTPIDRSYDKIEKDIETMSRLINREIDIMQRTNDKIISNLVQEENDAHDCLSGLVEIYEECHRRLEECFLSSKTKIIEKIENVRNRYEKTIMELKLHLENYSASNMLKPLNKQFFKKEQILLFEHAVCSAIASQRKFQENAWLTEKREVLSQANQEKKKILLIKEAIIKLCQIK